MRITSALFPAILLACFSGCWVLAAAAEEAPAPAVAASGFRSTNGPFVFLSVTNLVTNVIPSPFPVRKIPPNLPPEIRARLATNRFFNGEAAKPITEVRTITNTSFAGFVAGSLNHLIWTNFIAHTNGRTTRVWSVRGHPPGWPNTPPLAAWDTNGLMWGMKGLTALSPCWEGEGFSGQVPITALTRRHGYTRGHGMGPDGFRTDFRGKKVWFVTLDNQVVEATVSSAVVRTIGGSHRDYTILLFNRDLPDSIQPLRVAPGATVLEKYKAMERVPRPLFMTEQGGNVSADVPPFQVPTWKGGDSGSPNMLPMPGELVFFAGRSTTTCSPEMQADMDELCRKEGLDPEKYQLQWFDLSSYPSY